MSKWKAAAALVVAAVAVAGCTRNLDMDKVKTAVREMVATQIGANVKNVACPEARPIKSGDTFDCTVDIDHGQTKVVVLQTDDAGSISMKTPQSVVKVGMIEKMIADGVKSNAGIDVAVDCGPKFRPSVPNDSFECTGKSASGVNKYKVTVKDDQGNVSIADVAPPPPPAGAAPEEAAEEEAAE